MDGTGDDLISMPAPNHSQYPTVIHHMLGWFGSKATKNSRRSIQMAFKPFKKLKVPPGEDVTEKHINAVQDNVETALGQLLGKDQLDSSLLKNVVLIPGIVNKIAHGLGRRLVGYIVVRNHGGYATLTDQQDDNPSPELLLYLTTPALVKVDLLVF